MKIIHFLSVVSLAGLFTFCSSEQSANNTAEEAKEITITETTVEGNEEKTTAKIALNGMSCEKMCGSMIKKCLRDIDGVKAADIDFDPVREGDFATVEFEPKKVTEKEMIAAIQKLNNGAYKVQSIEIVTTEVTYEKLDNNQEKEEESPKTDKGAKVSALHLPSFQVPNVFGVLTKILPAIQ